jgi:GMP synthase (glutamine-hydrolysing)
MTGDLFRGFEKDEGWTVWMSHGDRIERIPKGFEVLASSKNSPVAAMVDASRRFFGVQFHPEVAHTPEGPKSWPISCFTSAAASPPGPWLPL